MIFNWKNDYYRYQRYFFDIRQTAASPRFRSFTWLSITIFTVSFFLVVAIRPTLITIAKLQKEIKDKDTASVQLQNKIDGLIKAQAEMVMYLDDLEKIDQAIPDQMDYDKIAVVIEEIAINNSVNLKSLSFKGLGGDYQIRNGPNGGSFLTVPFNLSATGSFTGLSGFLSALENSRRLPVIERSGFLAVISETGNQLNLSITGNFLYQGLLTEKIKS